MIYSKFGYVPFSSTPPPCCANIFCTRGIENERHNTFELQWVMVESRVDIAIKCHLGRVNHD